MQPTYLPWLGYFDLIRSVDTFVIYDHVQFEKQSWQQRNRIRNKQGEIMLTVSVLHETGLERTINDVRIDHARKILKKHLTSIQLSYAKSPNFKYIFPEIEKIYSQPIEYLFELNIQLIKLGMNFLNIKKELLYSSKMNVSGLKVEALIDVCKKTGSDQYLSPVGSKVYIDMNNLFPENKIELSYQQFTHPVYQQNNYPDFISHLSFIDYLFNVNPDEAAGFGTYKTKY